MSETNEVNLAADKACLIKLAQVFRKEIEGIAGINHITIHVILPSNQSLCLTSSYQHVDNYVENKYGQYDHSLISRYTDNLPFYSWEICPLNKEAEALNKIKKETYGLQSGMNFVRKLDNVKIIYSVATFIEDPVMQFVMLSKANQILEAGDFLYNSFHDVYQEHTQIDLPKRQQSGLRHAASVLADIDGLHFTFFQASDVVRHPLVQRIVQAYEKSEKHS